jgi:oleate hydratase
LYIKILKQWQKYGTRKVEASKALYLIDCNKDPIEVNPTFYDIRYVLAGIKKSANVDKLTTKDLPKIDPNKIEDFQKLLVDFLNNNIEPMPSLYPGRDKKY